MFVDLHNVLVNVRIHNVMDGLQTKRNVINLLFLQNMWVWTMSYLLKELKAMCWISYSNEFFHDWPF